MIGHRVVWVVKGSTLGGRTYWVASWAPGGPGTEFTGVRSEVAEYLRPEDAAAAAIDVEEVVVQEEIVPL